MALDACGNAGACDQAIRVVDTTAPVIECNAPTTIVPPDAQISFDSDGGREDSGNFLVDNSRLLEEFELEYPPFPTRVLQIINEVRRDEGLPLVR